MDKKFSHYRALSPRRLEILSEKAIFSFDTSFLLNLYRYSDSTRERAFQVLEYLKPQIWLPYQAALEFHRNRLSVISEVSKNYKTRLEALKQDKEEVSADFLSARKEMISALEREMRNEIPITNVARKDHVWNRILKLFKGKVGDPFSSKELETHKKVAADRYQQQIPPGYKDAAKKQNSEGDYLIWLEMKAKAKENGKPVFFITSDAKEDWWQLHSKTRMGPEPRLRQEFETETGELFHIYETANFIKIYQHKAGFTGKSSDRALEEVERVSIDSASGSDTFSKSAMLSALMADRQAYSPHATFADMERAANLAGIGQPWLPTTPGLAVPQRLSVYGGLYPPLSPLIDLAQTGQVKDTGVPQTLEGLPLGWPAIGSYHITPQSNDGSGRLYKKPSASRATARGNEGDDATVLTPHRPTRKSVARARNRQS